MNTGLELDDRYRLDAELGRGGMGVVYRAYDTLLERDVAVKILTAAALTPQGRGRLLREARAVASLSHPNIVNIFDAGETEIFGYVGLVPYIVMEYIEGVSLHQYQPADIAETIHIASQVSAALDHAHRQGVIHRDLKPENILITTDGTAMLMDFGLASATSVTGSCLVGNSDKSVFNSKDAGQIATGNWWGVPTGPNTPGGDTTGGSVDTSGYLPVPILGCAPDLQVDKGNDVGGNAVVGTSFHWTLTVSNQALVDGTFNAGQTILEDDLPPGPAYGTPVTGGIVEVTNSANIFCNHAGNTLTCSPAGANVILGAEGGRFQVTIAATPRETGELVNPASGGNCWVDPDGQLTESDESDNNCPADTVNVQGGTIYLPLVVK